MNDKQNDKQRYPGNEEQLAEQTVRMLETRTREGSSKDDQATVELGRLLRDAAEVNLPASNVDLREQLMAELDGGSPAAEQVTITSSEMASNELGSGSTGRRRFWVAAAASGLLLVGGTIAYNSGFVGQSSNVALFDRSSEADFVRAVAPASIEYSNDDKGRAAGAAAPIEKFVFPDAETWNGKQLRRSHFTDFRLSGEPSSDGEGKPGSSNPSSTDQGRLADLSGAVPAIYKSDNGIIGQFSPEGGGREKAKLLELTQDLARSQAALEGDRNAMMEHIWILEDTGKIRKEDSLKLSDDAEQMAAETRIIQDLELQRDQLIVTRSYGPVDASIHALNRAITDREIRIKQLELKGAKVLGRGPEQVIQHSIVALKKQISDLRRGGASDLSFDAPGVQPLDLEIAELKKARGQLIQRWGIANQQLIEESSTMQPRIVSAGSQNGDAMNLLEKMSDKFDGQIKQIDSQLAALKDAESNTGEQYEPIFENAFIAAKGPAAISTFSIDVDTASYANMRRLLNSGQRPPADSIRLEELVNYFQYDYGQPTGEHPFSVNLDLADCPWQDGHQLLRVGLKGKDIHVAERPATNVVFLIDVSGSMSSNDKLPLLKSGFQMMSQQLGENDRVSIVTYAGNAGVVLTPTNGTQTEAINNAIERLSSGGSTHGSAGIKLAYELAQQNFIEGGVNRVMLATDGDLNVGVTSDDALVSLIKEKAAEGVFLTVLGFGSGNLKDAKLEKLADNGNGMYAYIDSTREARRVLVDQLSGSLVTIAKDVKIQVEFNPAEVKSYRLLGYENRMLETKDFDDDRKDAGEIGAGHTVTAIYQIEPAKAVARPVSLPAGMKYQVQAGAKVDAPVDGRDDADKDGLSKAAMLGDLATVALRYKQPEASESQRLEVSVKNQPKRFEEASDDFRFAASVAGFGMYLRGSKHRGSINAGQLQRIASGAIGDDEVGYRAEFIDLIRKASGR